VGRVEIGQDTGLLHDSFDNAVQKKGIGRGLRAVESQRFLQGNRAAKDRDAGVNGIDGTVTSSTKLEDGKVIFGLVKSKADVNLNFCFAFEHFVVLPRILLFKILMCMLCN
jgi:hypothetical protein